MKQHHLVGRGAAFQHPLTQETTTPCSAFTHHKLCNTELRDGLPCAAVAPGVTSSTRQNRSSAPVICTLRSMAATTFSPGPVGSTCQFTAALRFLETTRVEHPVMNDHLAKQLCGDAALELAAAELAGLQAAQGPGKHLRVPMRTRILEDWLLEELRNCQAQGGSEVQVVSMGSGLDTRPWRLDFPAGLTVHWICMDLPEVMEMKHSLLAQAGAQKTPRAGDLGNPVHNTWPLKCSSWQGLGQDLSAINIGGVEGATLLEAAFMQAGFDKSLPTFWVIEAMLYYMPLDKAECLLEALAKLSPPSSTLIATCVDTELLEASRNLEAGHIFAQLWHFDCNELLDSNGYKQNWKTVKGPKTTKDIAKESYNADTYVALYGGAEFAFSSLLV